MTLASSVALGLSPEPSRGSRQETVWKMAGGYRGNCGAPAVTARRGCTAGVLQSRPPSDEAHHAETIDSPSDWGCLSIRGVDFARLRRRACGSFYSTNSAAPHLSEHAGRMGRFVGS